MKHNSNCPCCNNLISTELGEFKDYMFFKCPSCFHQFYIPFSSMGTNVNNKLYQEDPDYNNDLLLSKDYNNMIQWNHLRAISFIKKNKKIKLVLDIGTYNGFFVKYLRNRGLEAYGYDFNEEAISVGIKNYNLDGIITANLSDLNYKKFDCITAFEVIEHLENPENFIKQFNSKLNDGGYLILSCPNNKMLWRPPLDYPPHHLSRFSPVSLSIFIEKLGYKVIIVDEQMSLFDLIRNYVGVYFRDKTKPSLKGGQFKERKKINYLKTKLNKSRVFFYFIFSPIDRLLYHLGFRYISQLIIAEKIK
jgi:SAM-dependent methyltransferase